VATPIPPNKTPCNECPFRRKSMAGYIGGHEHVVEILNIIHADGKFPCHKHVNTIVTRKMEEENYEDKDDAFDEALDEAPFCTGALAYANNTCKEIRDPAGAPFVAEIGKRDDVFANNVEMQAHHHGRDDVRYLYANGDRIPRATVDEVFKRLKIAKKGALRERGKPTKPVKRSQRKGRT